MNTNVVISFGGRFTNPTSDGFNFSSVSSPIIAPFWDDIDIRNGGSIYYRQDTDPVVAGQVSLEVSSQYPEVGFFNPALVFVATWDRVAAYSPSLVDIGLVNTFQAVIASDGNQTFVRFSYGDIQWGGSRTLIGVSAGDRYNFITHPASLSSNITSIDYTSVTYRIDRKSTIHDIVLIIIQITIIIGNQLARQYQHRHVSNFRYDSQIKPPIPTKTLPQWLRVM